MWKILLGKISSKDWVGAYQRARQIILLGLILGIIRAIYNIVSKCFTTPLILGTIIMILLYFPNVVMWIFAKIGSIFLFLFMEVIKIFFPIVFGAVGGTMDDLKSIYQGGFSALPADVLEFLNAIGVAELMGVIMTSIFICAIIRIYRSILKSARLI